MKIAIASEDSDYWLGLIDEDLYHGKLRVLLDQTFFRHA